MPDGAATRTGICRTLRPSSATPASCAAPPVRMMPGGQHPDAGGADLVGQQLERLAHARLDDLADLEPAHGPAGVLAEDRDADLLVVGLRDGAQVARAVADLELLGDLQARLEPDGHVVGDVVAADRQDRACGTANPPGTAPGRSCPAPMSATATPSSFSVSDRTASADASESATSSSILTPAAATHLVRFWTAVADAVTMWVSTSRRRALMPERILDALLAVDREPAPLDVEDLAVRRDRHRPRDLDRAIDVLAGDLAVMGGDRDLAGRVEALDVLAADADERAVDLPAGQPLGSLDRVGDRADRLVDVDDDALLQAGRRDGPVAHDRQPAVAAHLADERADLARADVDADEDRFPFHHSRSCLPSRASPGHLEEVTPDQRHVVEDAQTEGDEGHEVQVQARAGRR